MSDSMVLSEKEAFSHIDHTALKADTAWEEIETLCKEALHYHMASVCIPACYVKRAGENFPGLNICTVIGFPLGHNSVDAKLTEAVTAVKDGASEIDMVINLCDVKNKNYKKAEREIVLVKEAVGDAILKVIIETCYLSREEKIEMCKAVTAANADFIKTSTGFGPAGAALEDIYLMKEHIGPNVKIKAAGGISTKEELFAYLDAGSERIGTSSAISILTSAAKSQL